MLWIGAAVLVFVGAVGLYGATNSGGGEPSSTFISSTSSTRTATTSPSTAPTSTSSTAIPTTDDELFERCRERAKSAALHTRWGSEYEMVVGQPTVVVFFAGIDEAAVSTAVVPGAASTTATAFASGECTLRAQLVGALVDIDPKEAIERSFLNTDVLSWTWQVTPRAVEAKQLNIELVFVAETSAGLRTGSTKTETLAIIVNTAPELRDCQVWLV